MQETDLITYLRYRQLILCILCLFYLYSVIAATALGHSLRFTLPQAPCLAMKKYIPMFKSLYFDGVKMVPVPSTGQFEAAHVAELSVAMVGTEDEGL